MHILLVFSQDDATSTAFQDHLAWLEEVGNNKLTDELPILFALLPNLKALRFFLSSYGLLSNIPWRWQGKSPQLH